MSVLTVKNLKITENEKTVVDGVSFDIDEKGIFAVLGKSGSGKSTLAKALVGVLDYEGEIYYKDSELSKKGRTRKAIKAKIGYVPQKSFLYPDMTVYETLDFTARIRGVGADKRIRQIKEALELLEISNIAEALVRELSDSEQKKLLLANALIGNPSVLVIDEPTVSTTSDDAELIRDIIAMLAEKKTVILFTEKVLLANELAKHIGIMSKGRLELWSSLEIIKTKLGDDPNALLKTFTAFS